MRKQIIKWHLRGLEFLKLPLSTNQEWDITVSIDNTSSFQPTVIKLKTTFYSAYDYKVWLWIRIMRDLKYMVIYNISATYISINKNKNKVCIVYLYRNHPLLISTLFKVFRITAVKLHSSFIFTFILYIS